MAQVTKNAQHHIDRVIALTGAGDGIIPLPGGIILGPPRTGRSVAWTEVGWKGFLPKGPPHILGTRSAVSAAAFLLGVR